MALLSPELRGRLRPTLGSFRAWAELALLYAKTGSTPWSPKGPLSSLAGLSRLEK